MPAACSVMFRWQSCQSSSSSLQTSSMLSFVRCRFTLGFHRANVKPLSVNTRPFMNDSGDGFALAQSWLSSRHGAAPREMITAHRLRARRTDSILLIPEPLRTLRSETRGQVAACPDRTRAVPCTAREVTRTATDSNCTSQRRPNRLDPAPRRWGCPWQGALRIRRPPGAPIVAQFEMRLGGSAHAGRSSTVRTMRGSPARDRPPRDCVTGRGQPR